MWLAIPNWDFVLAGSEGDVAESSSECDEHNKLQLRGGTCSPFERRQFPRDSGCYDASLKSSQQTHPTSSPHEESDMSDSNGFSDTTNNLDAVVEQCNNEILARVRQAQKNVLNLKEEQIYQPNITTSAGIPNSSSSDRVHKTKDTYVGIHGQTTLIDPCRRTVLNRSSYRKNNPNMEDTCEADQKLTMVKYVVGGGSTDVALNDATASGNLVGRGACLSEKSSDSGVSSSSLCSANLKDGRQPVLFQTETAARGKSNFSSCANRTTSNAAK